MRQFSGIWIIAAFAAGALLAAGGKVKAQDGTAQAGFPYSVQDAATLKCPTGTEWRLLGDVYGDKLKAAAPGASICWPVKAQSEDSVFSPKQGTYGPVIRCGPNGGCFSDRQHKPDGKPPRLVRTDYVEVGHIPLPHFNHWECDPGYVLEGLRVTWPGGVFTPEPERCKAK